MTMQDYGDGLVYDGGFRMVAADGRRTRPYIAPEAAKRALARGELAVEPEDAPITPGRAAVPAVRRGVERKRVRR